MLLRRWCYTVPKLDPLVRTKLTLSLNFLLQEGKLHPLSARGKMALRQNIQVLAGRQVSSGVSSRGEKNQAGDCSWERCSRAGSFATCPEKWLLPCPK